MGALDGRVALVTGGSRGIGRAIAERLAADGAACVLTYRKEVERAKEVVAAIEGGGGRALALPLDLGEPEQAAPVAARVGEAFGRLDVVVASAAATAFRPMLEQKPHNVRRTLAITVESFVALVQAAVPLMPPSSGRILMISGIDTFQALHGHGVLGGAKAAAESMVRTLALELGPRGITVNGVVPGFIETDSSTLYVTQGLGLDYEGATRRLRETTPLRRHGTPGDVAALVAFLASDAASWITGQNLVIDGGLTITSPMTRMGAAP